MSWKILLQLDLNLDTNDKNIEFGDSSGATVNRLTFGAGTDLSIYHDSTKSVIADTGQGKLLVRSNQFQVNNGGFEDGNHDKSLGITEIKQNTELYHNNVKQLFETTSQDITGTGYFYYW